jgi:hypothetical protein
VEIEPKNPTECHSMQRRQKLRTQSPSDSSNSLDAFMDRGDTESDENTTIGDHTMRQQSHFLTVVQLDQDDDDNFFNGHV